MYKIHFSAETCVRLAMTIPIGTMVLVENSRHKQHKGGKMDDCCTGPYFIKRHVVKGVYELRNSCGMVIKKKVNSNRLKV